MEIYRMVLNQDRILEIIQSDGIEISQKNFPVPRKLEIEPGA